MTLFQDTGGDPRGSAAQFNDLLTIYGAIGDAACGNPRGFALQKARAAVTFARLSQLDEQECDAIYFAGVLHAIGAIGSPRYRKGERLPERVARLEGFDVPALGARISASIRPLPSPAADIIRWQFECWDGTGYPDHLRWDGIPRSAMLLGLADAVVQAGDPEEALAAVSLQSGRAYSPIIARTIATWYHDGAKIESLDPPVARLHDVTPNETGALLDEIADRIDLHNGMQGHWRRIERLTAAAASIVQLDATDAGCLAAATRLYGVGDVPERELTEILFDPLARLGIENRAAHALTAAAVLEDASTFAGTATVIRARSEWFDGTGKPEGLAHHAFPVAAGILAAAIAHDLLDRKDRIEAAAGTQFDPRIVRAILEAARITA